MKDTYNRGKIKFLTWVDGRQGSGYKIMYLWNWIFDLVIIRYPRGSYIKPHRDPVKRGRHHRINIELTRPERGANFGISSLEHVVVRLPRFVWFRPDIGTHWVTRNLEDKQRIVFSIGWIWGRNENPVS